MKFIYLILLFCAIQNGFSQKLSDDLKKRPDGITIDYFDYSDQKNLKEIKVFLSEKTKFKLPIKNNYTRINIIGKETEIKIIEKYLTFELIDSINQCCFEKNCPDSMRGYFLMIKSGNKIEYTTIDSNFIIDEKCGTDALKNIIKSFNQL